MDVSIISRPVSPPWDEGSKNMAWQIARNARRHRFVLLTTHQQNPGLSGEHIEWEYIYSDVAFGAYQRLRLLWYLLCGKRSSDIYHYIFVPTLVTSRILSRITRMRRKKSVQTVISLYSSHLDRAKARKLFFADRVVTISDCTASKLRALGVPNVVRINLGVDTTRYACTSTTRQAARKALGIQADRVAILFAGEYDRLGSGEMLKPVLARSNEVRSDLLFLLACRKLSPEDEQMETQIRQFVHSMGIEHSVRFLGKVEDFSSLLCASDILLYPVSTMVGKIDSPLTILEAMAAGLPIVTTDVAPLNEVLGPDAGRVVPAGDSDMLAEALLKLSARPQDRRMLGQAAQAVARARYEVREIARAYEELYEELGEDSDLPC
jgi:phosphatidylinositol alpha-1,6-mannosyltransferase